MIRTFAALAIVVAWTAGADQIRAQQKQEAAPTATATVAAGPAEPSWPQYNGPRGDNRSTETGLLKAWPAEGPRLLWDYDGCGTGFASVSVGGGMVFTAGDFKDEVRVLAFDMSGNPLWAVPNGKPWKSPWPGSRSTPTYNDGKVFHLNAHGRLAAFEAKTGREIWTFELPHEKLSQGGYAESMVIDGDNLICMPGAADTFVMALNKNTGRKVWVSDFKRTDWDRASYVTPLVVQSGKRRYIITMSLFWLMCLDAETGKVQWSVRHRADKEHCEVVAVTPVWLDGRVFITKGYGVGSKVFAVDPSGKSVSRLWEHKGSDCEHAAVVAHEGHIYVPGNYVYPLGGWATKESREGSLYCLEAATGEVKWVAPTGRCTLTYADGMLYCLDEFGKLMLIEANSEKCNIVSKYQIPRKNRGQTLVHPVVVGGRMYVRDHNTLYVYDVKD